MSESLQDAEATLAANVPGGDQILTTVRGKHAHPSVVMHALYGIYFQRKSIRYISRMLGKALSTVSRWVSRWERDRISGRVQNDPQYRKFSQEHREWIKDYFAKFPLTFIDKAAAAFEEHWKMTISSSHLWAILAEAGFTRKVGTFLACIDVHHLSINKFVLFARLSSVVPRKSAGPTLLGLLTSFVK